MELAKDYIFTVMYVYLHGSEKVATSIKLTGWCDVDALAVRALVIEAVKVNVRFTRRTCPAVSAPAASRAKRKRDKLYNRKHAHQHTLALTSLTTTSSLAINTHPSIEALTHRFLH